MVVPRHAVQKKHRKNPPFRIVAPPRSYMLFCPGFYLCRQAGKADAQEGSSFVHWTDEMTNAFKWEHYFDVIC